MAHYIVDLIQKAEAATGATKQSAEKACFEAILKLWAHRGELPSGKRPYQDVEPVIRAVESLDPDDNTPRYFRTARPPRGEAPEKSETEKWLDMVEGLDYSAKVLIGYCLAEAADAAQDKTCEWVKLAEAAGVEDGVPEIVIRFISTAADLNKEPDVTKELRNRLQERLKRLDGFTKLAETVAAELRAQLTELPEIDKSDIDDEDQIVLSAKPPFG
jgi:hypothetical protein